MATASEASAGHSRSQRMVHHARRNARASKSVGDLLVDLARVSLGIGRPVVHLLLRCQP